jgi:citrate lyase subunit beta/citryl-CoA lyase
MRLRSKLFVPGNRPDLMAKAAAGPADALSLDLEDAVPDPEKAAARGTVSQFLSARGARAKTAIVRVNGLASGMMVADILAIAAGAPDVVNVPKCESPRDLHVAEAVLDHAEREAGLPAGRIGLMANIETPAGLRRAYEIAAASPRNIALQLGLGDLKAATGLVPETARLGPVRTLLMLAAAEAGVAALDSAYVDIADLQGFEADAREARALGFVGKSCIHPRQVEACNRAFAPDAASVEEARALIAAYRAAAAEGRGAITFRGRLVDAVHAQEAQALLELAAS